MELLYIRLASLIILSLVYMLFDVFNKRNIPSVFVYASVGYGFLLTLLYLNLVTILYSSAFALMVLGGGYLLYKAGQLGAADVAEFAALSLILPIQISPLLYHIPQFNMPFLLSMLINTGIVAFVITALYYLPRAKLASRTPITRSIPRSNIVKALAIGVSYAAFLAVLVYFFGVYVPGVSLVILLLATSMLIILFEKPITSTMVSYVDYKKFETGDIIAMNLMSAKEIASARRKIRRFNRLVDDSLINEMRAKRVTTKFPVYKKAMPLALPIFISVCISLLFGDLLLFILPFATSLLVYA